MTLRKALLLILGIILLTVAMSGLFTVRETQQALVMQFGDPRRVVTEPGLHWKLPILQQARYFDRRILNLDVPQQEIIASDQKRLIVDAFARFRIVDPLLTYQAVRNESGAVQQLISILQSNVRQVLGEEPMRNIVSGERLALMGRIQGTVNAQGESMGVDIVDVRLRRVDLPQANSQAIFERMRTEREREAAQARAEGREQAARIRAQAERERTVLLAEANRESQQLRGEGDARAVKIFAEAFNRDAEFFEFYRSLQAYDTALDSDTSQIVLSPSGEFFKYFQDMMGNESGGDR